jgi:hypothetical protein
MAGKNQSTFISALTRVIAALAPAIVIGIILQVGFVAADNRQTPSRTAIAFTEAYFALDQGMAAYLCKDITAGEADPVDLHIHQAATDAKTRGFGISYVRSTTYDVIAQTIKQDDQSAQVRIAGKRRACIHPVFATVAKIFQIGETYRFEETINLVKEDGQWKVCGKPFALPAV